MVGYFKKVTGKIFGRKAKKGKGLNSETSGTKILVCGGGVSGKRTVNEQLSSLSPNAKWKFEVSDMDYFSIYGRGFERILHLHQLKGVEAVVFVIDSSADKDGKTFAYYHLERMMGMDELKHCSFAVVANKQDKDGAATADEIAKEIEEETGTAKTDAWKVFPATATTGDGLNDVCDWLVEKLGKPEEDTEEEEEVTPEKIPTKKVDKPDFLSSLVVKFKKSFLLTQIKA